MKTYKAPDSSIHCIDPTYEYMLPAGCIEITEEEADAIRAQSEVVPPIVVSPRQIRQALTQAGLRQQVEEAVSAGNQDLKDWWEFSTAFEENHPMVQGMAHGLGVSANDLHSLFNLASVL